MKLSCILVEKTWAISREFREKNKKVIKTIKAEMKDIEDREDNSAKGSLSVSEVESPANGKVFINVIKENFFLRASCLSREIWCDV